MPGVRQPRRGCVAHDCFLIRRQAELTIASATNRSSGPVVSRLKPGLPRADDMACLPLQDFRSKLALFRAG